MSSLRSATRVLKDHELSGKFIDDQVKLMKMNQKKIAKSKQAEEEKSAFIQAMSARGRQMMQERRASRRQGIAKNREIEAKARRKELLRPKSSVGRRHHTIPKQIRRVHSAPRRRNMEEVWARLATPKTTPRMSDEPIVRPDLKKWGIYPGQLPRPGDNTNGQNPVRPPYNTHFHPGQHKQRRKKRGKQRNTKKIKRKSVKSKSQQDTDLVVTAESTSRSIFVIHEGESDFASSSDEDGLPSAKPKRRTRTAKTKRAQVVAGKLPARRPLIKRKSASAKFKPKRTLAIDALAKHHISGRSKRDPNALPSNMLVEGVNSFNEKNRITKLSATELRKRIWDEFSASGVSVATLAAYEELYCGDSPNRPRKVSDAALKRCVDPGSKSVVVPRQE